MIKTNSTPDPFNDLSKNCPVCGSTVPLKNSRTLLPCSECSVVLDSNIWQANYDKELEREWFESSYDLRKGNWEKLFEFLNNNRTWKRIQRFTPANGSLLEIGVGNGSFLAFAKRKGWNVEGCDLSSTLCKNLYETYRIKSYELGIDSIPEGMRYPVIVMNHVLEHVADPSSFLLKVQKHMNASSILHLAVPNMGGWTAILPGWVSYQPYHLLYFNKKSLSYILEKTGFELVELSTHESFSGWFLALLRTILLKKDDSKPTSPTLTKNSKGKWIKWFYHFLMVLSGLATLPFRYLQAKMGYGDELIAILRVKAIS